MDTTIWAPESLYFKCLSFSGILLTTALLFYHMTKSSTLEMSKTASGIFSILLIFCSLIYLLLGTYSYYQRLRFLLKEEVKHRISRNIWIQNEIFIFYFYFALAIIIIIVEISLCFIIIQGCIPPMNHSLKNEV